MFQIKGVHLNEICILYYRSIDLKTNRFWERLYKVTHEIRVEQRLHSTDTNKNENHQTVLNAEIRSAVSEKKHADIRTGTTSALCVHYMDFFQISQKCTPPSGAATVSEH